MSINSLYAVIPIKKSNLSITINFDFNIICVQCNVIRNFIHIIPTPIIRSHRGLTNVQAISKAYSTEKSLLPYHVKVVYQYR